MTPQQRIDRVRDALLAEWEAAAPNSPAEYRAATALDILEHSASFLMQGTTAPVGDFGPFTSRLMRLYAVAHLPELTAQNVLNWLPLALEVAVQLGNVPQRSIAEAKAAIRVKSLSQIRAAAFFLDKDIQHATQ